MCTSTTDNGFSTGATIRCCRNTPRHVSKWRAGCLNKAVCAQASHSLLSPSRTNCSGATQGAICPVGVILHHQLSQRETTLMTFTQYLFSELTKNSNTQIAITSSNLLDRRESLTFKSCNDLDYLTPTIKGTEIRIKK